MRYFTVLFESKELVEITPVEVRPGGGGKISIPEFKCTTGKTAYLAAVAGLLEHIKRGDIYEINYCVEFFAENAEIDPHAVFNQLKGLTEAPFAGLYKTGHTWIICASPERFIRREGNKLISQPMKGTARRGQDTEEDEKIKVALAKSLKEQTENVMAVDVARNDLSIVAQKGSVIAEELFGVRTFKNIHQMVSTVSCKLKENISLEQVIEATFPPASMTGAPKLKAVELIKRYELSPRNIYSGALGQVDDKGNFDLCVVIRTIIYDEKKKRVSFHVGSAITANCVPEEEWNECLLKAGAMLSALQIPKENIRFLK